MRSKSGLYICCIVLQTVLYGLGNVFIKLAYESIAPFWCMTLRFGLAALIFILLFGRRTVIQLKNARLSDWLPGGICMASSYITCNIALGMTSATNVGFLIALPIVFTPFLGRIILKRPYSPFNVPIQIMVVVGLFLLCSNGGSFVFGWGEVWALMSALSLATALVLGEYGLQRLEVTTVSTAQISMAFLISLGGALTFEQPLDLGTIEPSVWGIVIFLALFTTCAAFLLQNKALTHLSATMVSLLMCGEPIFTALFSAGVLGESLGSVGYVGSSLIVGAVLVATCLSGREAAVWARLKAGAYLVAGGFRRVFDAVPVSSSQEAEKASLQMGALQPDSSQ